MNKTLLMGVLAGALALAGLAMWLLTGEVSVQPGGSPLRHAEDVGGTPPGFHGPAGEKPAPPSRVAQVERLPAAAEPVAAREPAAVPVRRISGRVVRLSDETPLGGAAVSRVLKVGQPAGSAAYDAAITDAEDGHFTLSGVPLDETEVAVDFDDTLTRETATYPLPQVAGDIDGLLLTYDSGFLITGRVTDTVGSPLVGASASVGSRTPALTDENGRFELRDVVPASERLSVDVWAQAPWFARETRAVNAPPDSRQLAHVELQLLGSGAIEGRVTDPTGQAVPDSEVRITASMTASHGEASAEYLVTRTDAEGHYRLDHVLEGRYLVQVGSETLPPADLAPRWIPDIFVQTGVTTRLDVELDHGALIEGRVTDASGVPLTGSRVTLERLVRWPAPEQGGSSISFDGTTTITSSSGASEDGSDGETELSATERSAVTGADGTYRFERVSPGDKRLTAIDAEQRCSPRKTEFTVAATEAHAAVDFVLSFGLSLRGRVTEPGGAPLEKVSVNIKPVGTQLFTAEGAVFTEADGWFEVVGLPEGEQGMMLNKQGYSFRYETVLAGDAPRTWVLSPSPQVHGLVFDALTGEPVLRFTTLLESANSSWMSGEADHPEGRFEVDVDDDSLCSLTISAVGYEPETKVGILPTSTGGVPLQYHLKRIR